MNSIPITCPSNFEDLKFTEHRFTIGSNNATIVCTDNSGTTFEQRGGAFLWVTTVLLIFNYIWEVKHREIIKYFDWDNSNKVCFFFEAGNCKTCLGCLKMFPPQLLILKQWIFLLFAFAAAQFITTQPDTKHYKNVAGFANSFVAMIGITLGIILNTSLQKHEDAIRLFEMYTGDIIALAMELTAFIENAGEGTQVEWNEKNMPENNSKLADHREKLVTQIVEILKKVTTSSNVTWKEVVNQEVTLKTEYPIFYTESRRFPQVRWWIWGSAYKQFKKWFPLLVWPARNGMKDILTFLETQLGVEDNFKYVAQTRLIGSRDYFLVSLERIFQTLYVLPQVTKHEFRDSPAPAVRFNHTKLKTLDIDYCNYTTDKARKQVDFENSRLYLPMNNFEEELVSKDGLSPTQIFLYTLLDYINEFHRSVGMESQTRKTLTSAWRRLYGTYGDMSTVKTYDLPRVITMTMELSLIGSCFMLPLSSLHGFVDTCSEKCQTWAETSVPFICVSVQFFLTGLYIAAQQVRNPFVSTQESLGFENVTKTAESTQIGIRQIWKNRGLVQMLFPGELNFDVCNRETNEEGTKGEPNSESENNEEVSENNEEVSKKNGEENVPSVQFLPTRRFDNRLYHGIRF